MLGEYSKVAIIKTNTKLTDGNGYVNTIIPLNLEFTPKYIIAVCQKNRETRFDSIVYPFNVNQNTNSFGYNIMGYIFNVSNKEFTISAVGADNYVKEIIAIS